jgi:small subunit ribosomal protein S6
MFILDSNAYARNPVAAGETIEKMVKDAGGEVLANRLWNEQKLAYPIKGRYKGTYWLNYCRMDTARVADFNRACQLNESILRYLIVKIDSRLLETLVDAAHGRVTEPVAEDAASGAGDEVEVEVEDDSTATASVDG